MLNKKGLKIFVICIGLIAFLCGIAFSEYSDIFVAIGVIGGMLMGFSAFMFDSQDQIILQKVGEVSQWEINEVNTWCSYNS